MAQQISRVRAGTYLVVALVALAAGAALYGWRVEFGGDILAVELSGRSQAWPPADESGLRAALGWDFAFILGYGTCLVLLAELARRLFWTSTAHVVALAGFGCAAAAIVADVVENVLLLSALELPGTADQTLRIAAGAAALKFSVLVVAVPVAVAAACTTLYRLSTDAVTQEPATVSTTAPSPVGEEDVVTQAKVPAQGAVGDTAPPELVVTHRRWAAGYQVPGIEDELKARPKGEPRIGFCVSGGGIRSASVAMGALQGLRPQLLKARYLTSVSGGGYTAGAMQLGLLGTENDAQGRPEPGVATPADVFLQGTPEEDHVRRHSSYIADGPAEWLLALGVVLRGLLASLLLVTAAVAALGVTLGLFYGAVPLVDDLGQLAPRDNGLELPYPGMGEGMTAALVAVGLLAGAAYVASLLALSGTGDWWQRGRAASRALTGLGLLLVVVGVAVPALVWASAAVLTLGDGDVSKTIGAGGSGAILLSYVAALAAMAWRSRKALGKAVGRFKKTGENGTQAVPSGIVQRLIVTAVLAVLAAVFLLILGSLIATAAAWERADGWDPILLLGGSVVLLAVLGGYVDQTWLGLHPFYRRRLASAFAVRRTEAGIGVPYDYAQEVTALSTHGQRRPGFPEVVFCCAANMSGQENTPPGRRAVGFTMTSSWIGGPDVGYLATSDVEKSVSSHLRRDLTVQAAVAISGAAFASAMGRQARSFQSLLALTNARLGTWLPNPKFVLARQADTWWATPRLPKLRRVTYLLREVFGIYPADERLLYVTDGGHYENIALVELLRRRCTEIYCIDASGDGPPLAGTLGEALSLAYEELGVRIVLDDVRDLVAGGGEPLSPADPLAALNGRLASAGVVRGSVVYPAESGLGDDVVGTIYFAKAVLTRELPYELLTYASKNPVFPHDSTGDQWFDTGQFNGYVELGRQLAEQVLSAQQAAARLEDARDGVLGAQA
jgi:hypothetical protein